MGREGRDGPGAGDGGIRPRPDVARGRALGEAERREGDRRVAAATGIALVELPGGTHGLGRHATDGTIFAALLANLRAARAARPGAKRDGRPLADAFLLDGLPPGVSC